MCAFVMYRTAVTCKKAQLDLASLELDVYMNMKI